MGFIDISAREQAREDEKYRRKMAEQQRLASGLVGGFFEGMEEGERKKERDAETKRQRAFRASELESEIIRKTGRIPNEAESKEIQEYAESGNIGTGLKNLFLGIGAQERGEKEREYKHKMDLERLKQRDGTQKEDKTFSQIDAIRKEVAGMPATKDLIQIDTSLKKMSNAVKDPSAAGDLGLVFSYMKMLDPQSTVREGEFANAQNAAGIPEKLMNTYNQALKGQRLNIAQREDFFKQAKNYAKAQLSTYKKAIEPIEKSVKTRGLDPSQIFTSIDFDSYDGEQQAGQAQRYSGPPMQIAGGAPEQSYTLGQSGMFENAARGLTPIQSATAGGGIDIETLKKMTTEEKKKAAKMMGYR